MLNAVRYNSAFKFVFACATIVGELTAGPVAPASAQTSFEGNIIRLSVNFAAGGPVDILARQFAPFIAKHTPGRPTLVVENRAGAGGMVGANHIFNATKPD